eukprot:3917709-Rhodomonas_salina.3
MHNTSCRHKIVVFLCEALALRRWDLTWVMPPRRLEAARECVDSCYCSDTGMCRRMCCALSGADSPFAPASRPVADSPRLP